MFSDFGNLNGFSIRWTLNDSYLLVTLKEINKIKIKLESSVFS